MICGSFVGFDLSYDYFVGGILLIFYTMCIMRSSWGWLYCAEGFSM